MNPEFQAVTQGRWQIIEKLEQEIGSKKEFTWIFTYADEKKVMRVYSFSMIR